MASNSNKTAIENTHDMYECSILTSGRSDVAHSRIEKFFPMESALAVQTDRTPSAMR